MNVYKSFFNDNINVGSNGSYIKHKHTITVDVDNENAEIFIFAKTGNFTVTSFDTVYVEQGGLKPSFIYTSAIVADNVNYDGELFKDPFLHMIKNTGGNENEFYIDKELPDFYKVTTQDEYANTIFNGPTMSAADSYSYGKLYRTKATGVNIHIASSYHTIVWVKTEHSNSVSIKSSGEEEVK